MIRICLLLSLLLFACTPDSSRGNTGDPQDATATPGPSGKEASRLSQERESVLTGLKGLHYAEAEAIKEYRNRIENPKWDLASAVLRAGDVEFLAESPTLLQAIGEARDSTGQVRGAILLLDLKNDMVFAGYFDEAEAGLMTWAEEDSVALPPKLLQWGERWNQLEEVE